MSAATEARVYLVPYDDAYRAEVMHWLCKPSPELRTHHPHLVPFGSPLWDDRVTFRDYLRRHRDKAVEYAELKRHLAARHVLDREAYTEAKGPFVEAVLALARAEAGAAESNSPAARP